MLPIQTPDPVDDDLRPPAQSLWQVFFRFLKFGALAFGGPVAQIAMIRRELVERDGWMSGARFNRLLAVVQALPGPEAHELCVHLGIRARGRIGGLLAGLGFMLPGFLLMTVAACAYFRFDFRDGWTSAFLVGSQAAVVALIVRAVHRIGEHVLIDRWLWVIGGVALGATLMGVPFWIVLPTAATLNELLRRMRPGIAAGVLVASGLAVIGWSLVGRGPEVLFAVPEAAEAATLTGLLLAGLKAGLLTFGGAYTAIPFLRQDVVGRGWMGDGVFLDGVALANVLPAPLIIFGTFAGYAAGGLAGAVAMTAGLFLPAFAFSMIFYERLEAIVSEPRVRAALDGIAAAVVGIIAATAISLVAGLGASDAMRTASLIIAGAALVALYLFRGRLVPPAVILAAGLAGLLAQTV